MKGKYKNYLGECMALSQMKPADLARAANTSPQNVNRLLNGERELTRHWAELFAPHLKGMEPADLIFGPDRPLPARWRHSSEGAARDRGATPSSGVGSADALLSIVQEVADFAISILAPEGLEEEPREALIRQAYRGQLNRLTLPPPQDSARQVPAEPSSSQVRASGHKAPRERGTHS